MTTTLALSSVTLLNASYEPLGKVSFKHAVRMLFRDCLLYTSDAADE